MQSRNRPDGWKESKAGPESEDAKHGHPALSITSHSLGFGGIASYPHYAMCPDRCEELTHWKRPWCWERLKAEGLGDDRRWDGWMVSLTRWTWVWVSSRSGWWTRRPVAHGVTESWTWLHDWTELRSPHRSANACLISCNFSHSSMSNRIVISTPEVKKQVIKDIRCPVQNHTSRQG